jgi:translation initiation factor eIF-2B subunit epsilon
MAKKQGGGDDAAAKHEQPLQAVLLADSFVNSFRPVSLDRPKVLCPLNNVTLLDYAMDFLAGAGVEHLFVVCVSDQVEAHVEKHAWTASTMQVTVVKDNYVTNAGDALRELDKQNLVQSDPFILMFGDVVTNVDLVGALAAHKERHKKDSSAMMTLLMKQVGATIVSKQGTAAYSSIRANTEDLVVGLDPSQENRIMVYDDHNSQKSVPVPCSFFASHPQIDMRCDLLDCGIDICSPDVLARFSDEFDYRDIRREFVANSVAEEEEGLQNKIFAHILKPTEYAARIHDFQTYAAVSQDLLRRWCYPVVPDNLPSGYEKHYRYTLQRHYMYHEGKHGKSRVGRSSTVQGPGMLGSDCSIGEDCRIQGTVLGNGCHVESKVTLKGSHVWDNVHIAEGATVVESILAEGCVVKAGAVVSRGCIIGAGCIIGENVVLPEYTRLTLVTEKEDDDFDDDWDDDDDDNDEDDDDADEKEDEAAKSDGVFVSDKNVVGPDGKGRVSHPPPVDDDEDDDSVAGALSSADLVKSQSIGFNPSTLYVERQKLQTDDDDGFSDDGVACLDPTSVDWDTNKGQASPQTLDDIVGRQKGVDVIKELKLICLEFEPSGPIENLAIELNSFKFSQNATYSDCTKGATLAILELMNITKGTKIGKLVADFKSYLENWAPLLQKMCIGLDEEMAIVVALEIAAAGGGDLGEVLSTAMTFRFLVQTLFDEEVVTEEAILKWAAERSGESDESPRVKLFQSTPVQEFLEWLAEESDEDDEDDSEEEEDE